LTAFGVGLVRVRPSGAGRPAMAVRCGAERTRPLAHRSSRHLIFSQLQFL